MKKIICLLAVCALLGMGGTAFAAYDELSTTAEFQINTAGDTNALKFGLSPKVIARYVNPGVSESTAQWYSLGTVHPGGTVMYGTAQDLNNIYSKSYTTGTAVIKTLLNIAVVKSSVVAWTSADWSL